MVIAAHYAPIAGQSVGINKLIVKFLRRARKLNPPCPLTVPSWDLSMVLKALRDPPLKPLLMAEL